MQLSGFGISPFINKTAQNISVTNQCCNVVERVVQDEIIEHEEEEKIYGYRQINLSEWNNKRIRYLKLEKFIRENPDQIPTLSLTGSLNYGMSLKQMKDTITKKFTNMVLTGHLLTQEQFSKQHDSKFFHLCKGEMNGQNLTRIWGAEFLKSHLLDDRIINVAEHFLIIEESSEEVEVAIDPDSYFPIFRNIKNAYIYSKKITGFPCAWEYRFSEALQNLGYRDFKDSGNIICDPNGTGWVVDTEIKGFDLPKLTRLESNICNYLKRRFEVLAGEDFSWTFKISINDIFPKKSFICVD